MKVGLFAPFMTPDAGGVWQFCQWIVARVGQQIPMHLALPQAMLDEIAVTRALPPALSATSTERALAPTRASRLYRVLEDPSRGQVLGVRVPLFKKATRRLREFIFGGSLDSVALVNDLRAHQVHVIHVPQPAIADPLIARRYPYVINPHDYQHEHFPEFFSEDQLRFRRRMWYPSQRAAAAVVVHSLQTRSDVLQYLRVPEDRVFYAPYGPLATFPEIDEERAAWVSQRLRLPERFVFYPARMWQHKNHVTLLEALEFLKKQRKLEVACVFTDAGGPQRQVVIEAVIRLGLKDQVQIIGRVTPEVMGALYRLCTMVVVPSLFEQNSGPMLEAIHLGKAIAVSNLPDLVNSLGEAGLVFDPLSVYGIANAIDEVFSSADRKAELEQRARERRGRLSWEPFIRTYQKAYAHTGKNRTRYPGIVD